MKRERVIRRFFVIFGVAVILIWGACSFLQEIWEPRDVVAVLDKSVDTTPPTITITYPTNGQEVGNPYELSGNVRKGAADTKYILYSTDGISFDNLSFSGTNWNIIINISEYGIITNYVYAVDTAGNESSVKKVWVERTSVPSILITSFTDGSRTNLPNIDIGGTASVDSPYTVTNVEVQFNDGEWQTASYGDGNWSVNLTLNEGSNTVTARATADSGKSAISLSKTINLDTIPPDLEITSPTNGQEIGESYEFTGTVSDTGSGVERVEYSVDGGGTWNSAILNGDEWDADIQFTKEGSNRIYVRAFDDVGNGTTNTVDVIAIFAIYVNVSTGDDTNKGYDKALPVKSIQRGINSATNYKAKNIYVATGVYTPGNGLNTESASYSNSGAFIDVAGLTISGGWDDDFAQRDGMSDLNGQTLLKHIIWINNVANVTIDGFVIRGGNAQETTGVNSYGGGVYINQGIGHLITNAVISNNTATNNGGGVYVNEGIFHTISGTITGNTAFGTGEYAGGGGVYVHTGTSHAISATITGNTAYAGGGVYVTGGTNHTINATIISNIANNNGGGVHVYQGAGHTISATITGNTATNANARGGGVSVYQGTSHTISGTISGNTANAGGGGVFVSQGTSHAISATITGNTAAGWGGGGGVLVSQGTSHAISATITGNSANTNGGGVHVRDGTGHTISGAISGNTATSGGGVYFWDDPAGSTNTTHTFVSPVAISNNSEYGVARWNANSTPQGITNITWGVGEYTNKPADMSWTP
jgi:hypothetical protein